jgi:hypothetical protein
LKNIAHVGVERYHPPVTKTIGALIRNSTFAQRGNYRSVAQYDDLEKAVTSRGWEIRWYDEQATSGADLAKRKVATGMLADLKAGTIQGIAVMDIKRASRDRDNIDFGIFLRTLREVRGVLVTPQRVYNPRNKADARTLRIEGLMAGMDWEDIRDTTWSGRMKRLALEPVCVGPVPRGYKLETDDRGKRHLIKDPDLAADFAALVEALDTSPSVGAAVKKLLDRGITAFPYPEFVRRIIHSPIYYGRFQYGRTRDSDVWEEYAEITHECPELAYWTELQALQWRKRFDGVRGRIRVAEKSWDHPLLGVLYCSRCGRYLVGHSKSGYRCNNPSCPGRGLGNGGGVTDDTAFRLLRERLPELLDRIGSGAIVAEAGAQRAAASTDGELEATLAVLDEQEDALLDLAGKEPTERLRQRLGRIRDERERVRLRLAEQRQQRMLEQSQQELLAELSKPGFLEHFFDRLTRQEQGLIYRELLKRVEIAGQGIGRRRRSWIQRLEVYPNELRASA